MTILEIVSTVVLVGVGIYILYQLLLVPVYRLIDMFQKQEEDFDYGYYMASNLAYTDPKSLADSAYGLLQMYDSHNVKDGIIMAVENQSIAAHRLLVKQLDTNMP